MFFGEYLYKVDEKGRIPLPPKFRRELAGDVILSKGTEKNIIVYPLDEWKRLSDDLEAKVLTPAKLRRLKRDIFGSAFDASFDKQGRVTLQGTLRSYAEIGDAAVVVGVSNCIEIWDEKLWAEEKLLASEQASEIIEGIDTP